jgi:serine/threonine protein kinase
VSHGAEDDPGESTSLRTQLRKTNTDADPALTLARAVPPDSELTRVRPGSGQNPELTRVRAAAADAGEPSGSRVRAQAAVFGEGYLLRERYQLIEPIGQGAMGQVWKARDTYIEKGRNRFVAIKVFRADFQNHPQAFQAMQAEASRAMQLAHPNIVTVHILDLDTVIGRPFIVMELLEGQPLDKLIRATDGRGVAPEKAWPIIKGMSEGLAYAHRKGLVHSDFKPANVFLTTEGVPKVLDFGIARAVRLPGSDSQPLEDESVLSGYTTMYAAPETLEDHAADTSDDVFALGLVAYELLAARHPFNRIPATEARERKLQPQPLKGLKRREWRAIEKALALARQERFADATAFLRALQGLTRLQSSLIAAVVILSLVAGGLWYRSYLDSRPAVDFNDLPLAERQLITAALADGHMALRLMKEEHIIDTAENAAADFAKVYALHPRDPDAVAGLKETAATVIEWAQAQPDRKVALSVLQSLQTKADYYKNYTPLTRAIERARSQ